MTSGSTGAPKLIIGRKSNAEDLARVLHQAQDSEPVRETIVSLPLTYCYAFVNQWLWSKTLNRKLIPTAGLARPEQFRDALRNARDAMVCLVGPQAAMLCGMFGPERFEGVIRLHFAGGRFPQERLQELHDIFHNADIFNNYGCAEALPRLTVRRAEEGESASDVGIPLPGVELKSGAENQLLFRSPYRCVAQLDSLGFLPIPSGQWLPNGDLVRESDNGHWHLLGRTSEVFKRYGEKISSAPGAHNSQPAVGRADRLLPRERRRRRGRIRARLIAAAGRREPARADAGIPVPPSADTLAVAH